ncbi:hypothetical protein IAR55_003903 [Kwoniella newhampshirensis]|uniref:t-SNARE coiled-coil homology domain-containing protein n=1 Tax=Kwoniella newhampshirensis TaxID=1651941 RepID=A0AAW0YL93_9TREE
MSSSTPASVSQRLTTTSSLLLERSRIISLNLKPSPSSQSQIFRNLAAIRSDLDQLELEAKGLVVGGGVGRGMREGRDGEVEELGDRYDRLLEMLEEDEVGREKLKSLRREVKRQPSSSPPSKPTEATTPASTSRSISPIITSPRPESSTSVPRLSVEPPTPAVTRPFKDFPDDDEDGVPEDDLTPHDMLSNQQMMMNDQDERLNLLSHSIGRQNHLSIQIGSELDLHHQLLEETDTAMDRTAASLGRARRRLDKVANEAKRYGSTLTIVGLIFVLLILIIVFKT